MATSKERSPGYFVDTSCVKKDWRCNVGCGVVNASRMKSPYVGRTWGLWSHGRTVHAHLGLSESAGVDQLMMKRHGVPGFGMVQASASSTAGSFKDEGDCLLQSTPWTVEASDQSPLQFAASVACVASLAYLTRRTLYLPEKLGHCTKHSTCLEFDTLFDVAILGRFVNVTTDARRREAAAAVSAAGVSINCPLALAHRTYPCSLARLLTNHLVLPQIDPLQALPFSKCPSFRGTEGALLAGELLSTDKPPVTPPSCLSPIHDCPLEPTVLHAHILSFMLRVANRTDIAAADAAANFRLHSIGSWKPTLAYQLFQKAQSQVSAAKLGGRITADVARRRTAIDALLSDAASGWAGSGTGTAPVARQLSVCRHFHPARVHLATLTK